jgi:hypothetical protein
MTDNKSPGDRLLELVVFGPTGLAVTIVEEFPKLVEKGRHRVEGQVHTARLVGQFAVQMGRRQLEQSLGHLGAQADAGSSHGDVRDGDVRDSDVGAPDVDRRAGSSAPGAGLGGARSQGPAMPGRADEGEAAPTPWRPSVWLGSGGPNGSGSPSSLAIPGYDSLSASQVVQRLEGLSSAELEEVRAHEAAHRQRRTILHRVEQLLTGGDSVPS